jgi:predicted Zn-dependent peptidase
MDALPWDPAVRRTGGAGVPVLWSEAPGACTGVLYVRSGQVDETLRTGGINHLVEHMALFPVGRRAFGYNGRVDTLFTSFYAEGEPEEVAGFLAEICGHLAALPLDRLDVERRVLLTEGAGRPSGLYERLLHLRFGAVAHGVGFYEELGLGWIDGPTLERWTAERFTAGNAVAWMSAPPPEGFELALPAGPHVPVPAAQGIPSLELPAELQQGTGGVVLCAVGERSTALSAAIAIAARRAHDQLRRDAGLTYAAGGDYEVLDARTSHVMVTADCRDHDAVRVRDELLAVVDALAEHGPTEEELDFERRAFRRAADDPQSALGFLDQGARNLLLGAPASTRAELLAERDALTPGATAAALADALRTLLVLVPSGTGHHTPRLRPYVTVRTEPVEGVRYEPTVQWQEWHEGTALVVGREGFSMLGATPGSALTIRFDECVAAVPWLSGSLTLVDRAGATMKVIPALYRFGEEALWSIREAIDQDALVPPTARERELTARVRDQLSKEIRGTVPHELDRLAAELAEDEPLELLATAKLGLVFGLLALTGRRLLFLSSGAGGVEVLDIPRAEIGDVAVKGLVGKRLVVPASSQAYAFTDVKPPARLPDLRQAMAGT